MNTLSLKFKQLWINTWVLFRMSRPDQLVAVSLVYLLGLILARVSTGFTNNFSSLWGLIALIFVSASIHYANEYADHETDAQTKRTLFSGGSGALSASGLSPRLALTAGLTTLGIGLGFAVTGLAYGWINSTALIILALGAFFGWMYSLPPLSLAWRCWGELDNALLGGMLLPLYGYSLLTGKVDNFVVLAVLPFSLIVFINLLATTWADRKADAAVGKNTLATRWSKSNLRRLFMFVALTAYTLIWLLPVFPTSVRLASLLSLPFALLGAWTYTRWHNPFPTVFAMLVMLAAQIIAWVGII